MTRVTTALITAGPRTIGPWGDRAWRVALSIQLVEGGSAAYFLATPTAEPINKVSPAEVEIAAPFDECTLDALILTLAAHLGGSRIEALLEETHNISVQDDLRRIAPFWDLSHETMQCIASELAENVRLGIMLLDEISLVQPSLLLSLRDLGFDVDLYSLDIQLQTAG